MPLMMKTMMMEFGSLASSEDEIGSSGRAVQPSDIQGGGGRSGDYDDGESLLSTDSEDGRPSPAAMEIDRRGVCVGDAIAEN